MSEGYRGAAEEDDSCISKQGPSSSSQYNYCDDIMFFILRI